MAKVGLVFGGRSVEHRVSVVSARTVAAGLTEAGHQVVALGIAEDGRWVAPAAGQAALDGATDVVMAAEDESVPASLRHLLDAAPEVIFPIVHGTWGEDGTLQGLCEMLDLPYAGADVAASAVAMDKLLCKRLLASAGVPVVDFESVAAGEDFAAAAERAQRLPAPWFVKPSVGGSSVGIRKVTAAAELEDALAFALGFDDEVIVERGVTGREIECAVLGYPSLQASVLGEIEPGREFYDYEDKYLEDTARLLAPAPLPEETSHRLRALAIRAFQALGGTGMARVDFFLAEGEDGDQVWVNEINTLPGFTKISMYPRLWDLTGVPIPELVDRLVQDALTRHRNRHALDRGIKEWLGSLG
ncbi:MAG: D-alanine--D-alanine ligase family protein [Acidobacteriota bacterium]